MKVVVCVKQVAVLGDEIEFTADGRDVDPVLLEPALNEWDAYAVEEAVRMREVVGDGEVVVVSVGPQAAEEAIRRCLAMGADRGVRVEPRGAVIGDALTVARLLAPVVRDEEADVVLCGVQSSDSLQGATGTALAAIVDLPCVAVVKHAEYDHAARRAVVHRELEGGLVDVTEVATPALLTIQTGINEPRYVTMRAIRRADQEEVSVVEPAEAVAPAAAVRRLYVPPKPEGAELLDGGVPAIAERIKELVEEALA
jgi:electron transfer flavoprotein beta subunit